MSTSEQLIASHELLVDRYGRKKAEEIGLITSKAVELKLYTASKISRKTKCDWLTALKVFEYMRSL